MPAWRDTSIEDGCLASTLAEVRSAAGGPCRTQATAAGLGAFTAIFKALGISFRFSSYQHQSRQLLKPMRFAHGLKIFQQAACRQAAPWLVQRTVASRLRLHTGRQWPTLDGHEQGDGKASVGPETPLLDVSNSPASAGAVRKPRRGTKQPRSAASRSNPRVTPRSHNHHDLESFLAYATSTALDPASTVYRGTHFEYLVSKSLSPLGFRLTRVGGSSDLGTDLIGHWILPSLPAPLPALIQCKATTPASVMMRELEGTMTSAPVGWKGESTIGLLAANKAATKGVRDAMARSSLPLGFLYITADGGLVKQFIWNQAAVDKCGLEGVGVGLRHPDASVVLTIQGEPLPDPPSDDAP